LGLWKIEMDAEHSAIKLLEALQTMMADQQYASFAWRCLTMDERLLHEGLRASINRIEETREAWDVLSECWEYVSEANFQARLAYIVRKRGEDKHVDISRLVRNTRGLISTAAVARAVQEARRGRNLEPAFLATWVRRAIDNVGTPRTSSIAGGCFTKFSWHERDLATMTRRLLNQFVSPGSARVATQYWILYWLRHSDDLERGAVVVPVMAVVGRSRRAQYGLLHLMGLEDGVGEGSLVEHPESALLPLGSSLISSIDRAWRSNGKKTVCWNLRTGNHVQDGDSLGAAAAIGMNLLLEGQEYDPSCLVLARLGNDGSRLEPVSFEYEKIQEARRNMVNRVAIAPRTTTPQDELMRMSEQDLIALKSIGIRLTVIQNMFEGVSFATETSEENEMDNSPSVMGRYTKKDQFGVDGLTKILTAYDDDQMLYLVKLWPWIDETESMLLRALWDGELRNLYRLSSSPRADDSLLTMKDAGVDESDHAYVMVLRGKDFHSYETLGRALADRTRYPWLQRKSFEDPQSRYRLWQGIHRIASGIELLHSQDIMHRNVGAETVYFDPAQGPESWRLGGFEWSLRLGSTPRAGATPNWSIPPENKTDDGARYTFEGDWYAFGMLIARCFYAIEGYATFQPAELNRRVLIELDTTSGTISDLERTLVSRLITKDSGDRLTFGHDVLKHIEEILRELSPEVPHDVDSAPLVLVVPKKNEILIDMAIRLGFVPDRSDPITEYNPDDERHVASLKTFFRQSLEGSRLYAIPNQRDFVLDTNAGMTLRIKPHVDWRFETDESWDFAFAAGEAYLGSRGGRDQERSLEGRKFNVVIPSEVSEGLSHQSWEPFLPIFNEHKEQRSSMANFREFLRCTNQLELLMAYAEIFPCLVEKKWISPDGEFDHVLLAQAEGREHPAFSRIQGGMVEAFQGRIDTNAQFCRNVLLTSDDILRVPNISLEDAWEIVELDRNEKTVQVKRKSGQGLGLFEHRGYARSWDLYGQTRLLQRRKRAIDQLEKHSYLLRSLAQPGMVRIDTGAVDELPHPITRGEIDESKMSIIKDILRARPIYALQGPPGTGKTTLVSYLLREILEQDPVAQILVTAQAHGAVDVLREKVQTQAFKDREPPLAIRIGLNTRDLTEQDEGSGTVRQVTHDLLTGIRSKLENRTISSPLQRAWFEMLPRLLVAASSAADNPSLADVEKLVQLGASITYCTTSSGDLEALAGSNQSFDWCVVEEAGKAHGFDLALPLQTAHRWLLLGDYKQLPPYRYEDFKKGLKQIETVVNALDDLPGFDTSLVDYKWIDEWRERQSKAPQESAQFSEYALRWLETFKTINRTLKGLKPANEQKDEDEQFRGITTDYSKGAWAGQLTAQYRMHPTVGNLISSTFYEGSVRNETVDAHNRAISLVVHPLIWPEGINGKAILWLDTPWCKTEPAFQELGPDRGQYPRYTNPKEIELIQCFLRGTSCSPVPDNPLEVAILSPYAQQVAAINRQLSDEDLPSGLKYRQSLGVRRRRGGPAGARAAHTVDSFQGNQADIVVISLVRNNLRKRDERPLGFLDHPQRLNVLLSRAERLLVLVGSWEFFTQGLQYLVEDDPMGDWLRIMRFLEERLADQTALRIPSDQIINC
jgi:serine/threonine protein kinase